MKIRTFTLLLVGMLAVSVYAQKPVGEVMKASVPPIIDGVADNVWDEANVYDIALPFQEEIPTVGEPGETNWRALWDDDGVYVLVTVTDDEFLPNWKDAVGGNDYDFDKTEIYFDCNYTLEDGLGCQGGDNDGHHQYAPPIVEDAMDGQLVVDSRGYEHATLVNDPNYVVEYFMPWDILTDLTDIIVDKTGEVGFDVTVIDRETGDPARKRAVWNNIGGIAEAWANMDDCGIIVFDGAEPPTFTESIELSAEDITENNGTVQVQAVILPAEASQKLVWTIVEATSTGRASINSDGVVTGIVDGDITVNGAAGDGSYEEAEVTLTVSGQIVTRPEINLIRNGYMDDVNEDESAAEWNGGNTVIEGIMAVDPSTGDGVNTWSYTVTQQNFGCNTTDMYTFSFVAWAAAPDTFNVDFEDSMNGYNRYGTSTHELSNGESDWTFVTNMEPTKYVFDVVFDELVENTRESCQFMIGLHQPMVYLDSIELINDNDLALITEGYVAVETITVTGASSLEVGGTSEYSAEVLPVDADRTGVNWMVEPGTGWASIDAAGMLTADSAGTVTVMAMAKDDSKVYGMVALNIGGPAGVEQHTVTTLKVYPNPAVNELNVVLSKDNSTVTIYNSVGMRMDEVIVTGTEYKFNISDYASGIYFVKTGNQVAKFVK